MEDLNKKYKGTYVKVRTSDLIQAAIASIIYMPRGIQALADSITSFGGMIRNPKVIGPDANGRYHVLDGWRRVLAAILLGWEYIWVEVMENLPEEDIPLFIVECNNYREKTPREKYEEIKLLQRELPNRQGQKGNEKYNQREAIAERMNIADSEVRDLLAVGGAPNGTELLDSIDGKAVTLTALARKVKEMEELPDYSGYVAVEPVDLEPLPCNICACHPTKRIEIIDRELYFVN